MRSQKLVVSEANPSKVRSQKFKRLPDKQAILASTAVDIFLRR